MNNKRNLYCSDTRYEKVYEQMQLLDIQDVSTERQIKNGTIVWRLPIKNEWDKSFIEVASFSTGYVRNQNSGYSNYHNLLSIDIPYRHHSLKLLCISYYYYPLVFVFVLFGV